MADKFERLATIVTDYSERQARRQVFSVLLQVAMIPAKFHIHCLIAKGAAPPKVRGLMPAIIAT